MDYAYEFARQGLGYLISVLLASVIVWQQRRIDAKDKMITDLQDKRIADTNQYTTSYTDTTRQMILATKDGSIALGIMQKSVDSLINAFNAFINKKQ